MGKEPSRFQRIREETLALWNESPLGPHQHLSRVRKFAHFWIMVWKSFSRNRCPVHASALAYGSLLALVPMLAVAVSVTSTFLKKEGEDRIDQFIAKAVATVTGSASVSTNSPEVSASYAAPSETNAIPGAVTNTIVSASTNETLQTPQQNAQQTNNSVAAFVQDAKVIKARKDIARTIHQLIQNTQSGTLGLTGSVLLIFAAISMLSRIEDTFNDIWGVSRGRGWLTRIIVYWGVITLAPLLLVFAASLATGPHVEGTRKLISQMPFSGWLLFQLLPVAVLCLTFALFYVLMPNTKVRWRAALVGGLAGAILFHVNNSMSALYVSRVVSNSKLYGGLGLVLVFMIGLYLSWLILLFGAQVTYAFQNRAIYFEDKQTENFNQRAREFVALRLMTCVGHAFVTGNFAPNSVQIAESLGVPSRLVRQIMQTLVAARLVAETGGSEPAYLPARPLHNINCHDILLALRATRGQELPLNDTCMQSEVLGEFNRIAEAERHAASSVTLLDLVQRSQAKEISL
jgi:membrane protein